MDSIIELSCPKCGDITDFEIDLDMAHCLECGYSMTGLELDIAMSTQETEKMEGRINYFNNLD